MRWMDEPMATRRFPFSADKPTAVNPGHRIPASLQWSITSPLGSFDTAPKADNLIYLQGTRVQRSQRRRPWGLRPAACIQLPCFGRPSRLRGLKRCCAVVTPAAPRSPVNAESHTMGVSVYRPHRCGWAQFVEKNSPSLIGARSKPGER